MDIAQILTDAVAKEASDVFIVAGSPVAFRIGGAILPQEGGALKPADTERLVREIYAAAGSDRLERFLSTGDADFSFSMRGVGRFRVNAYMQRGSQSAVLRVVRFELPDPDRLSIPGTVMRLADVKKGLVLVTGPAGSGKSTTLSCLIDRINKTRNCHIVTLEDPIEFLHRHGKSIVSQREIGADTDDYVRALRAALRQSPNVILLGEMRDFETINIAMTAAETGQLVLSTLHTVGAANTIDRIIDVFPPAQQHQIRVQLSMVLQAVVSQQLIPAVGGGLVPAFEIMIVNSAIRNMIRESKVHQIDTVIHSGGGEGMVTMDASLFKLYKDGLISADSAKLYCTSLDAMLRRLS